MSTETSKKKLLVCGGGTGGHFFSGLAVAEIFLDKYPHSEVIFLGSRYGIEARYELSDPRMSKAFVMARGVKGRSLRQMLLGVLMILIGCLQSFGLLIRFRPHFVLGVGGYASVPGVATAILWRWLFRWKVIVLDQNSSPGMANKVFSKCPVLAYCAFPYPGFQLVNLPLRKKFTVAARSRRPSIWPPKTIFILGGSQGARGLNEAWRRLVMPLKTAYSDIKIIHQTGAKEESEWREFYASLGVKAEVFAFSDQMERLYDDADFLISRSGAMTVFEIMTFERPALFVPFPAAADDHQTKNALSVQDPKWVVKESDLNWSTLEHLLRSDSPAVPKRSSEDIVTWDSILR